ncbi:MAG TPA: hypothetical protein VFV61_03970 [Pyrinomonadaceae bacterium]|nr:hypothetical protein [Pyrinomonadaceae bacterium]
MRSLIPSFPLRLLGYAGFLPLAFLLAVTPCAAQDEQFGPVVRAYLGYLRNEQEVVDDRASRREVSPAYYRHNSNRIRALRQIAIKIARETQNDYLPELEAVSRDELRLLFEQPPRIETLKVNEVFGYTLRFLGSVRSGETFYVFARLDPYEQAELREKGAKSANPRDEQGRGVKVSTSSPLATPP